MKTYPVSYSPSLDLGVATCLSDFSFPWREGSCPSTEFRAVWNEESFAFSFKVADKDFVLPDHTHSGEGALGSDRVELFFATSPELKTPYYGAEMDPSGRVYDYAATFYREIDPSWRFSSLRFHGEIRTEGYDLHGKFAMSELRDLDLVQDGMIIAGVYRAEFSHDKEGTIQDWISWIDPATEKPDFHVPSSFGKFVLESE